MQRIAYYFLILLIFTIPWQAIIIIPGLGTITRLIGIAAIGIGILIIIIDKKVTELPLPVLLMIIFIIWNIITYFWSIHPARTIGRVITYVQLFAMVWLVWNLCKNTKDIYVLMQTYLLGSYIAIIDMLITYYTGRSESFRITATGFDHNAVAISLAIGIPMSWYLLFKWKNKILYLLNFLYIPLSLFCVILTASRSGFITTIVACSIIPLSLFYVKSTHKYLVAVSLLIMVFIIPMFLTDHFSNLERNIMRLGETGDMIEGGALSYREVIWSAGFKVFSENTIIGVGAGGFSKAVEDILIVQRGAHNAYLSVLVDTGIIGLVVFISIIIIGLMPNLTIEKFDRLFYLILCVTLLVALIPLNWESHKVPWLVMILLTSHTTYVLRSKKIIQIYRHNNPPNSQNNRN
jgi:O-antigen ligase